jgi:cytochrome c oxidase subunit II
MKTIFLLLAPFILVGCAHVAAPAAVTDTTPSLDIVVPAEMMEAQEFVPRANTVDPTNSDDSTSMMVPASGHEDVSEMMADEGSSMISDMEERMDAMMGDLRTFTMTAKQWEFEPSEITVQKGDTVRLTISSVDVAHGFALADFGISEFLAPGKTSTVEFVADKVGRFSFFCNVSCGRGHREMNGLLIVE